MPPPGYAQAAAPKIPPQTPPKAGERDAAPEDPRDAGNAVPDASAPTNQATAPPATHPPVVARQLPQWETRRKRKARSYAARDGQSTPQPDDDSDGSPPSSPCPPPPTTASKRKRIAADVGLDASRAGTTSVTREAPASVPTKETYSWMTHQATPGPSGTARGGTVPYDLRRHAPDISTPPSVSATLDMPPPPFPASMPSGPRAMPLPPLHANVQSLRLPPLPPWTAYAHARGPFNDQHALPPFESLPRPHGFGGHEPPRAPSARVMSNAWPHPMPPHAAHSTLYASAGVPPNAPRLSPAIPAQNAAPAHGVNENGLHSFAHTNTGGTGILGLQPQANGWRYPQIREETGLYAQPARSHTDEPAPMDVDPAPAPPRTPAPRLPTAPSRPMFAHPHPPRAVSARPHIATPFPRGPSARPLPRPPTAPIFAPNPRHAPQPPTFQAHPTGELGATLAGRRRTPGPEIPPLRAGPAQNAREAPPSPEPLLDDPSEGLVIARKPTDGDWPEIHGAKPDWQYDNIPDFMETSWKKRGFPKCLVATAGRGACDPGEAAHVTAQETTISQVFGVKARVIQAQPAVEKRKRNESPLCNMVQVARQEDIQRMLDAKCISVRGGLTLFFFPTEPDFPTLMVIVSRPKAFGTKGKDLSPVLRDRLSWPIHYNCFRAIFQKELAKVKRSVTADELTVQMIGTVYVAEKIRHWRGEDIPLAAIYCKVPTTSVETWKAVREVFRKARLGTDITGHPYLYTKPLKCGTCHGVDHDTGMCEFPLCEEWFGPPAGSKNDDDEDDEDETDQRGRHRRDKRGFRGYGRGGGAGSTRRGGKR